MSERRFNPDNYIDVQERINRFWHEYRDGAIITELMSDPSDFTQCRYRAMVYKQFDEHPAATGWAFEIAGTAGANRTSHEENCETSAIGRALANMGYATTREDRPSKQEMGKVSTEKPKPIHGTPKATPDQIQKADDDFQDAISEEFADEQQAKMRPEVNRQLHWEAEQKRLNHEDLHALVITIKGVDGLKHLDVDGLGSMRDWLKTVRPAELDVYLKRAGRPTIDERLATAK